MRVLHVELGRHLYGGALQVRYLLEGLSRRGVQCHLACPEGSAIAEAAAPFATVHPLGCGGELDARLLFSLRRLIRREGIDLLHAHSRRGSDHFGALAARSAGCKALVTRRVDNPEPPWLARLKYGLFHGVVTISEGIRRVLLSEGVSPERVECVPSAVDTHRYRPGGDRDWLLGEFGLPAGAQTIGVIAQLIERKGHRFLIEAAPGILERHPQARFIFFGQGPVRAQLEARIREAGLESFFVFAGFRRDMERILPSLDLVAHPALMEGLGVSLLQASACAVPLVAAASGGIPEVVTEGENGYLVPAGSSEVLVGPIVKLLSDPALRAAQGEAGRRLVEERFSIPAMVEGNLRVYRRLLGRDLPG